MSNARKRIRRLQLLPPSVEPALPAPPIEQAHAEIVLAKQDGNRVPHSATRKVIARRLLEAKATVQHYYLNVDCQIDALLALRIEFNNNRGIHHFDLFFAYTKIGSRRESTGCERARGVGTNERTWRSRMRPSGRWKVFVRPLSGPGHRRISSVRSRIPSFELPCCACWAGRAAGHRKMDTLRDSPGGLNRESFQRFPERGRRACVLSDHWTCR
ncbi:2-oxo acid dehydrogenase subunit E2 [Mesorhizobium sp. M0830]|uniref:2-oxo acid dehydrogenase subunit E2 n=1 Tax=Mesorhizobium sp. M0830 TaxID=2957008 RepID=UPI00333AE8E0